MRSARGQTASNGMSKSFLIIASVVAAAVVGYIVYMSYFAAKATVGKDAGVIGTEEKTQPFVMPATEEEKLNALNSLTFSANATSTASDNEKEKVLDNSTGSAKNDTAPAGDSEKIRLLESLKN